MIFGSTYRGIWSCCGADEGCEPLVSWPKRHDRKGIQRLVSGASTLLFSSFDLMTEVALHLLL